MINDLSDYRFDAMGFGGYKYGSMDREGVRFPFEETTQPKVVGVNHISEVAQGPRSVPRTSATRPPPGFTGVALSRTVDDAGEGERVPYAGHLGNLLRCSVRVPARPLPGAP
jgi:hypothetical protein